MADGDGPRQPRAGITPFQQMLSSCSGAIVTSMLVTPLDVVKIRLQSQQKPFLRGQCFLYCNGLMDHLCTCVNGTFSAAKPPWYKLPGHFGGTMDAFVTIARTEGVTSLWSGLPPTLVMAVPATVIYFTAYDQIKYSIGYNEKDRDTMWKVMVAGAIARVGAVTVINPLEMVRTKMQSTSLTYAELGKAVRSTIQQGGLLSMMRGLGPTILRDVPFSCIYWYGYESMKAKKIRETGVFQPTFSETFLYGATAGTIAGVLTLPFDVIKTHRQIELGELEFTKGKKGASSSTWKLLLGVYKQQGVQGLFAGIVPRLIKVTPACAIMISTYEYGKTFFRKYNAKKLELETQTNQNVSVYDT